MTRAGSKSYRDYERHVGSEGKHRVRKSCKKCIRTRDSKNEHRFHGYGSFERTHISYCETHCCGAQNDSQCYSEGQLKRYRKKKTNKRKKRSR